MSRRIWSVNAGKIENKKKSLELIQQKTYLKDKGYQLGCKLVESNNMYPQPQGLSEP